MRRHTITPRDNWQKRIEKVGVTFHTLADGTPYWDESAYWEFSAREIDRLEGATNEIQRLALAAGEVILNQNRLAQMGIPTAACDAIRTAWNAEPPALYGRLDLAYDGDSIKLLEYNADTPTAPSKQPLRNGTGCRTAFPMRTSSTRCTRSSSPSGKTSRTTPPRPSTSLTPAAKKIE
jgi:glutathionylspermidine synthase